MTFNELAKLFAMVSSYSKNASHLQASVNAYEMVKRFDVLVHGAVSANEALASRPVKFGGFYRYNYGTINNPLEIQVCGAGIPPGKSI